MPGVVVGQRGRTTLAVLGVLLLWLCRAVVRSVRELCRDERECGSRAGGAVSAAVGRRPEQCIDAGEGRRPASRVPVSDSVPSCVIIDLKRPRKFGWCPDAPTAATVRGSCYAPAQPVRGGARMSARRHGTGHRPAAFMSRTLANHPAVPRSPPLGPSLDHVRYGVIWVYPTAPYRPCRSMPSHLES